MLKRSDVKIFHHDMTPSLENWQLVNGLFAPAAELALQALRQPSSEQQIDVVLRITYPYNFKASSAPRTCVFAKAEAGIVSAILLEGSSSLQKVHRNSSIIIITPSNWSRLGFINSGAQPERVIVIPHGVEPSIYKPLNQVERDKLAQS